MTGVRNDPLTVFSVDDDSDVGELTATRLERADDRFDVTVETSVSAALDRLGDEHVDCVVSEHRLPEMDGLEFLSRLRDRRPDLPFILFTGHGSEVLASEAIAAGVTDYLPKQSGNEQYERLADRIVNAVASRRVRDRSMPVFTNAPDPVVELRFEGDVPVVADVNPAFEDTFPFDATDVIGQPAVDTVVPEAEVRRDAFRERVARNERIETGVSQRTVDGTREFLLRVVPFDTDSGSTGAHIWYTDVTAHKRREQELRRLQRFNQEVVENAPVALFRLDEELRITYENPQAERIVGVPDSKEQSDAIGTDIRQIPSIANTEIEDMFTRLREGEEIDFDFQFESIYGKTAYVSGRAVPLFDQGEFDGGVLMAIDISERKRRERELQRQNERLEEFTNIVSHDLRNPLSVASGNLALLREEFAEEHLDAIDSSLSRIDQIIEDMLTMARAGYTVEDTDRLELSTFASDCWAIVDTGAATLQIDGDAAFEADPSRLQHILENLFRNAIEHGDDDVTVRVGDHDTGFYVADDGEGVPDEVRERIFERGFSTTTEGTGFGLSIVKQMVEAHGWEISVTESWAGGARFEIGGMETR